MSRKPFVKTPPEPDPEPVVDMSAPEPDPEPAPARPAESLVDLVARPPSDTHARPAYQTIDDGLAKPDFFYRFLHKYEAVVVREEIVLGGSRYAWAALIHPQGSLAPSVVVTGVCREIEFERTVSETLLERILADWTCSAVAGRIAPGNYFTKLLVGYPMPPMLLGDRMRRGVLEADGRKIAAGWKAYHASLPAAHGRRTLAEALREVVVRERRSR